MRTFACVLLGSALIAVSVLLQLSNISQIDIAKAELKRQKALTAKYERKFNQCRDQLGVFYRDPCLDNPKFDFCE